MLKFNPAKIHDEKAFPIELECEKGEPIANARVIVSDNAIEINSAEKTCVD